MHACTCIFLYLNGKKSTSKLAALLFVGGSLFSYVYDSKTQIKLIYDKEGGGTQIFAFVFCDCDGMNGCHEDTREGVVCAC